MTKTVSGCFAVLQSVRRFVSRPMFQSLAASLVLTRLDHGSATLDGIPQYVLKRLKSVMNSAARLVRVVFIDYDRITPLLRQLHWLKAAERINFKLAVLVYKCLHGAAPSYLADELCQSADFSARSRLRSASSSSLVVRRTRLSIIDDRAFPVATAHVWNALPQHVTSAPSVSTFHSRLSTHLLQRCFPFLSSDFVISDTLIARVIIINV